MSNTVGGFARVTKKKDGIGAWRIFVNGQRTNLVMSWDRYEKEWDLATEADHLMSASSMGRIMARLEILTRELPRGFSLAVNPVVDDIDDALVAQRLENQP